jgi:hypothetical protein
VGARKKLSNGRRAAKLARRRSAETAKKLKKKKHRNRMEVANSFYIKIHVFKEKKKCPFPWELGQCTTEVTFKKKKKTLF